MPLSPVVFSNNFIQLGPNNN